jgi:hypothetical protein
MTTSNLFISLDAEDGFDQTGFAGNLDEFFVGAALATDETAERNGGVFASVDAIFINVADVELDGGVVFGGDDAVGGRAFARDVKFFVFAFGVDHTNLDFLGHVVQVFF